MKKLPICDCSREGWKKITNGYICKRCHDIEKRQYKDSRGNLFKHLHVYHKTTYNEIGKFALS